MQKCLGDCAYCCVGSGERNINHRVDFLINWGFSQFELLFVIEYFFVNSSLPNTPSVSGISVLGWIEGLSGNCAYLEWSICLNLLVMSVIQLYLIAYLLLI